jgi:prepilin-type N-terminal cleavage/methylation domain-containing protein
MLHRNCFRTGPRNRARRGYTLVELVVVLILLTIAAAIVAPSLVLPRPDDASSFRSVIRSTRESAVRRAQTVRLHIHPSGAWQASAGPPPGTEILMSGRLTDARGSIDLLFSPLGTCGPAPEDPPLETYSSLDPLTCEVRSR